MILPIVKGGLVATYERLSDVIATSAPHAALVWTAVRDHGCGFAPAFHDVGRFELRDDRHHPLIGLIGDDMHEALGPRGFDRRSIRRLVKRCDAAFIVSSRPEIEIYAEAIALAATTRWNVLIVETRPEREVEWIEFVRGVRPDMPIRVSTPDPDRARLLVAQAAGGVH